MTVTITQDITDIAGVDDNTVVWFAQVDDVRAAGDGTTMVSTRRVSAKPVSGTLTIALEPGPCRVEFGNQHYDIEIPDIDAPLLPLILAGLPPAPPPGSAFIRNFGGITGAQVVTAAWFDANPHDPTTLYILMP
ncbi:hypothetical protein BJY24_004133 [Nocardia transvalensis]|uniref:Uncharacterized protein n=1 Tax=Nocardia transvalensis TaxID=37333 RepID=A0A7W9PFJ5_9NOCA|nr:hypothetical protein [Nocardia transvalensis]MBB5915266.1 hypothetical protein [Nocardia transvalensis]